MAAASAVEPDGIVQGKHDREGRRRALIDAATTVFAECGYDAATTREVAQRAGCAEGLIHRYFGGKQGLLIAILRSKAEDMARKLTEEVEHELPDRDTVEQEIEQLLLRAITMHWENRDFMRVAVSRAVIDPEVGRTTAESLNRTRVEVELEKLRRHQAAGRIRADVDLEAASEVIVGFGFEAAFIAQVAMQQDRDRVRYLAAVAAAMFARGLEPRPAHHPREGTPTP